MGSNSSLTMAKKAKNDEFYTQIADIEEELKHYWAQLRGKSVYCNCDDPNTSEFWHYFDRNFDNIGIKALVSTHYTPHGGTYKFEVSRDPDSGRKMAPVRTDLSGNGDFRSSECIQILKEAEVVVTNPPFSLLKEYVAQLVHHGKQFIIIGNMNLVSSKEIFPMIRDSRFWLGYTKPKRFLMPDGSAKEFGNIVWYTNIDILKRHEPIPLTRNYDPTSFPTYDNCDAINVDRIADIPKDYYGTMGVPLSFISQRCPEQFELVGIGSSTRFFTRTKKYERPMRHNLDGTTIRQHIAVNNTVTLAYDIPPVGHLYCTAENTDKYLVSPYNRLLIRRVRETTG